MNITKIMTDLLKAAEKEKTVACNYGKDDEFVYYLPDGYRGFRIPAAKFLVDLGKALPNKVPINAKKFFDDSKAEAAVKTNELRNLDKGTVVKIKSENNHAWINVNYLKEFDSNCTFTVINRKSSVYVYENEELVGLILPVNLKED